MTTDPKNKIVATQQRQRLVSGLSRAIELEQRGDRQKKKGRHSCAARRYRRAIDIESKILGADHSHTIQLRMKLLGDSTEIRPGSVALKDSFFHERQGDYYHSIGCTERAVEEYAMCLHIERFVLGKTHCGKDLQIIHLLEKKQVGMSTKQEEGVVETPKGLRIFNLSLSKRTSVMPRAA
jgi:hypothetical protein